VTSVGLFGPTVLKFGMPIATKLGLADWNVRFAPSTPGTLGINPRLFAFERAQAPIRFVAPGTNGSRLAVMNRDGIYYPDVPDLRTGRPIPFPDGDLARIPKTERVSWDRSADRYAYIREWHDRGYETPRGGWGEYDIHHIRPREFGGDNTFWNLVPVQRKTHVDWFNKFWRGY